MSRAPTPSMDLVLLNSPPNFEVACLISMFDVITSSPMAIEQDPRPIKHPHLQATQAACSIESESDPIDSLRCGSSWTYTEARAIDSRP